MEYQSGLIFAALATVGFGSSAVFARVGLESMRSATGTLISLFVGFSIIMSIALITSFDEIRTLDQTSFLWFALLGFINFPMGRFLNFSSVQLIGVARSTPIVATAPLFATGLAILLLGEQVTAFILIGTSLIVLGLVLVVSDKGSES